MNRTFWDYLIDGCCLISLFILCVFMIVSMIVMIAIS